MELATGEQFQSIIKEMKVFRQQAIETTNAISNGCKALSQASKPKVTTDYKKSMNEIADRTAERINEKLIGATDNALERVRKGSPCMLLSATAAFLLFIVLFVAIAYFGISLAYNHYILHSSDLFKIQYWCLGMAGVPLLITWISLIWIKIRKHK